MLLESLEKFNWAGQGPLTAAPTRAAALLPLPRSTPAGDARQTSPPHTSPPWGPVP
jgi:hypothetical protein